MDVVHVVNSILSFASGVTDTASVRYTGLDLSDRDTLPTEFAFQGNIISTPETDWRPDAEGSLVYCFPGATEFGNAYTEQDLQLGIGFTCGGSVPDSSRWNTGNNVALTEAPDPSRGDLGSVLPWCAAFGVDDEPHGVAAKALPELGSSPPLSTSGVALDSLPYVVEAPRDRGGSTRNPSVREPAGAWLP
jgi:hypothetical protein